MSSSKTLVLIAYYAPPAVGVPAERFTSIVRHLRPLGWKTIVVAPQDVHFHRGELEAVGKAETIRVPNPEPSRWLRETFEHWIGSESAPRSSGDVQILEPADLGRVGKALRRLVRSYLYIPDAQFPWIRPASLAVARVLERTSGPKVVYSSSVPYSAHFVAKRAIGRRKVPWIAEYRDPWSAAPPQFGRRPLLRRHIDRRLDHSVIASASRLVVTSDSTRSLFLDQFADLDGRRIHVIRNGWRAAVPDAAPGPDEPLTLVYNGSLINWEWAVPLLLALKRLGGSETARLRVFGPRDPWRRAADRVGEVDDLVELPGMIPGEEMPEVLAQASAGVLLQPDERLGLYVFGKAYEYLGSRRPVLAWIPEGIETTRLIRQHGDLRRVSVGTAEGFLEVMTELLEEHRRGILQGPRVAWADVEPLSRRAQVTKLGGILNELVQSRRT